MAPRPPPQPTDRDTPDNNRLLESVIEALQQQNDALVHRIQQREFGERSEEGERWNQKRHQKVQKEEPQLPLSGSLPLSGTQELTGDPLRGKMGIT
ncbi:hypothetical protein LR48_Vigan02g167200 [Vigna angularis]|uniref:Uncharacterized protein n=1 Tax=Phaseolus angularis TaxID=3914 RepID=A0A0L9TYR2_PHAAN|nr:hypothetical protein LR48_Vigan02g167200 [Vigna angularis]